jgi:hypothetical protein
MKIHVEDRPAPAANLNTRQCLGKILHDWRLVDACVYLAHSRSEGPGPPWFGRELVQQRSARAPRHQHRRPIPAHTVRSHEWYRQATLGERLHHQDLAVAGHCLLGPKYTQCETFPIGGFHLPQQGVPAARDRPDPFGCLRAERSQDAQWIHLNHSASLFRRHAGLVATITGKRPDISADPIQVKGCRKLVAILRAP